MPQTIQADVVSIRAATDFVHVIQLKPQQKAEFKAGQYLQIVLSEQDKRIFSIASSPNAELIELHIGAGPDDEYPMGAIKHLQENEVVTLEIGLGNAFYRAESTRPVILVAGGTGFSYVKSIADYIAETKPEQTVFMYWGVKEELALYAKQEMETWAQQYPNFRFIPVVEQESYDWQGKTGYVHQAVMEDIVSLEPYDIYLAGPFTMAGIARTDFMEHGALLEHMFADAFAYI